MQIIKIIEKAGPVRVIQLVKELKITPQAVHRHLKRLCEEGALLKEGRGPQTRYSLNPNQLRSAVPTRKEIIRQCSQILGAHPAVRFVSLFGSQARGDAGVSSDIDLLIWLGDKEDFDRKDLWLYWDRQAKAIPWANRVSLVVRRLRRDLCIDTLLLDMPEEHVLVIDRANYFERIRSAVVAWREKNGAVRLPSFGGRHSWKYSTKHEKLEQIDFSLEVEDVA